MLFAMVTGVAAVGAAAMCAGFGGFESLAWLWMLPALFVGSWLTLAAAGFGLPFMIQHVFPRVFGETAVPAMLQQWVQDFLLLKRLVV